MPLSFSLSSFSICSNFLNMFYGMEFEMTVMSVTHSGGVEGPFSLTKSIIAAGIVGGSVWSLKKEKE